MVGADAGVRGVRDGVLAAGWELTACNRLPILPAKRFEAIATRNRRVKMGPSNRSRSTRMSRRRLLAAASRAGVGAGALALAGCGPSRDFSRPQPPADRAEPEREEQQPAADNGGAARPAAAPGASAPQADAAAVQAFPPVDPLDWRERYHWRRLAAAPLSEHGPQRGGVLRLAAPMVPEWSPYSAFAPSLLPLLYSQLTTLAAGDGVDASTHEVEGDLAESWEMPDPLTISFTLRNGPVWPDRAPVAGRAITAEDVRTAVESLRRPDLHQSRDYAVVDRIEADDESRSVSFHLQEPAAYFLLKASSPRNVIVPPELIAEPSSIDWMRVSRGSGPFILSLSNLWQWTMRRNPDYFKASEAGAAYPYIDQITNADGVGDEGLSSIDRTGVNAAWRIGAIDQYALQTPRELEEALTAHPGAIAQVTPPTPGAGPSFRYGSLEQGPFADPRVRRALSMSLDRVALAGALYGGLASPDCGLDWTFVADGESDREFREWPWTIEELGATYRHDPVAAAGLLDAAGYSAEQPLEIRIDAPPDDVVADMDYEMRVHRWATETVRAQLSTSLGDTVRLRLEPRSLRDDALPTFLHFHSFEVNPRANLIYAPSVRVGRSVDVDDLAYAAMHSRRIGRGNWAGINDPEIDRLCLDQRREFDSIRRSQTLEQIRAREAEQAWRLFLVNPYGMSVRREYVYNLSSTYFAKEMEGVPKQLESTWLFEA